MIQILDSMPKKPKFLDQLMTGAQNAGQQLPGLLGNMAENQALSHKFGQSFSGINDPKMRQLMVQGLLQGQNKKPGIEQASQALDRMESMIGKTGVGMGGAFSGVFLGDARKNRGEFEALQSAILPLFKSMFPRGMTEKEFKFINEHYMPQLGDTEDKIKGKISGLRQLMQQDGSGVRLSPAIGEQKERPPLSSFHR